MRSSSSYPLSLRSPLAGVLLALLFLSPPTISFAAEGGVSAATETAAPGADKSDYTLERGDILSIAVWQNQELTRTVTVLPNGKIIFPLTGAVSAAERSLTDFKKEMEQRLRAYIPEDLVLTINVEQPRSMVFYIIGKVNRPGEFSLPGKVDILQALAMAGGLNEFAKSDRIKLFRKKGAGTEIVEFDYDQVSKGENLASNILLQRADTLVIP